jgi:hypothetical protein
VKSTTALDTFLRIILQHAKLLLYLASIRQQGTQQYQSTKRKPIPARVSLAQLSEKNNMNEITYVGSPELKGTDNLSIHEFAEIFGFTAAALIDAINRNRRILRDFNSIPFLAARWSCSRAKVYDVLHETDFKLLDFVQSGKEKGKRLVPRSVVEQIERSRMRSFSQQAA